MRTLHVQPPRFDDRVELPAPDRGCPGWRRTAVGRNPPEPPVLRSPSRSPGLSTQSPATQMAATSPRAAMAASAALSSGTALPPIRFPHVTPPGAIRWMSATTAIFIRGLASGVRARLRRHGQNGTQSLEHVDGIAFRLLDGDRPRLRSFMIGDRPDAAIPRRRRQRVTNAAKGLPSAVSVGSRRGRSSRRPHGAEGVMPNATASREQGRRGCGGAVLQTTGARFAVLRARFRGRLVSGKAG